MTESERMYYDNLMASSLGDRLRERDSYARTYARAVLGGRDGEATLLLRRFELAEMSVNNR